MVENEEPIFSSVRDSIRVRKEHLLLHSWLEPVIIVSDYEFYDVPGEETKVFPSHSSSEELLLEFSVQENLKRKKVSNATQTIYSVRPHFQKPDEKALVTSTVRTQTSITALPEESDSAIFFEMRRRMRHKGTRIRAFRNKQEESNNNEARESVWTVDSEASETNQTKKRGKLCGICRKK